MKNLLENLKNLLSNVNNFSLEEKINIINEIKIMLHEISPLKNEPIDCVQWIKIEDIIPNSYNPNSVALPEFKLLKLSIEEDGYTQPIVVFFENNKYEIVDGFHRNRIGREFLDIKNRVCGYLPVTIINKNREEKCDRIASTIRHNRARGKHDIDGMVNIIVELKRRGWKNERISKQLGMDADEVLRYSQISGLLEMFSDKEFSKAWEIENIEDNNI